VTATFSWLTKQIWNHLTLKHSRNEHVTCNARTRKSHVPHSLPSPADLPELLAAACLIGQRARHNTRRLIPQHKSTPTPHNAEVLHGDVNITTGGNNAYLGLGDNKCVVV
jgi:hypothetical protein